MPVSEIRFLRLHLTEEAARAAAMNDLAAFKAEFPEAIVPADPKYKMRMNGVTSPDDQSYREYVLKDRYADYGLICVTLHVLINEDNAPGVGSWLQRLFQAKLIEGNPLRR